MFPITARIGCIEDGTDELVAICGIKPVGKFRTKLSLLGQDPVTLPLPRDVVEKVISDYYENNLDALSLDLTKNIIQNLKPEKKNQRNTLVPAYGPEIGELVEGLGVYAGIWKPKDKDGISLGMEFNLYAAPQDLCDERGNKLLLSFNDAVKHVGEMYQGQYGYDGFDHSAGQYPDEVLYDSLANDDYNGEWFIPPVDALTNVHANHHIGCFSKTFSKGSDWYWACEDVKSEGARLVVFSDGMKGWNEYKTQQSVRLVRAEPR